MGVRIMKKIILLAGFSFAFCLSAYALNTSLSQQKAGDSSQNLKDCYCATCPNNIKSECTRYGTDKFLNKDDFSATKNPGKHDAALGI